MPMNRELYKCVPNRVKNYMEEKLDKLLTYDYVESLPCYTLFDDSMFIDGIHLRTDGGRMCSMRLNEKINIE